MPEFDPEVRAFYEHSMAGFIKNAPPGLGFTEEQIKWVVEIALLAAQLVVFKPPKVV